MITDQQLIDYSQELLNEADSRRIEIELRDSVELRERLNHLLKALISGQHSLGEIWRAHHLSCPERTTWGRYLLKLVEPAELKYLEFHLLRTGCQYCQSQLEDLREAYSEQQTRDAFVKTSITARKERQERFFQSSRGHLAHD